MCQNRRIIIIINDDDDDNNYNNNINNYNTSIAALTSKRVELSGGPSTEIGQTDSQNSSTNDQMEWKLRKD